uniref:Uncharacterized protein n=1 Tax=Ovis aries TaxID=9940 RepID=A0AC11CWD7_SHEEP
IIRETKRPCSGDISAETQDDSLPSFWSGAPSSPCSGLSASHSPAPHSERPARVCPPQLKLVATRSPAEVAHEAAALLVQEAFPAIRRLHPALPGRPPVLPEEWHGTAEGCDGWTRRTDGRGPARRPRGRACPGRLLGVLGGRLCSAFWHLDRHQNADDFLLWYLDQHPSPDDFSLWPRRKNNCKDCLSEKHVTGTSLVVQGLRIHSPVQGTWVRSLVREQSSHRP